MKKLILLPLLAIIISITSCRKERSCECTVTKTSVTTTGSVSITDTEVSTTKTTDEKATKKYFRVTNKCYNTVDTDTEVHNNTTITKTTDSNCSLK